MTRNLIDAYLESEFGVKILYGNDDFRVVDAEDNTLYVAETYLECIQYVQDVLFEGR